MRKTIAFLLFFAAMPTAALPTLSGRIFVLRQDRQFLIVHNNVPVQIRPEAKRDGETVTIPEGAVLYVMSIPIMDSKNGTIINVGLEIPDRESEIPMDMYVRLADLQSANADVFNSATLAGESVATPSEAKELDARESAANQYYYTGPDDSGGFVGHAGSGGRHRAGTTYSLEKVEVQAKKSGDCAYKPSFGSPRKSLMGFQEECGMRVIEYSPALPKGTICVSKGDNLHLCDGRPCGNVQIKLDNSIWLSETISGRPSSDSQCLIPQNRAYKTDSDPSEDSWVPLE